MLQAVHALNYGNLTTTKALRMQDDPEEVAARQRLSRLNARPTSSRPAAHLNGAPASPTAQSSASDLASSSGRHVAPPKLGAGDGWAAELDNDESWEGLEQKPTAGKPMEVHVEVHVYQLGQMTCNMMNGQACSQDPLFGHAS